MRQRNDKGQFATPDEKQISRENEELLGLYLDSLKSQKQDTKQSTGVTRERGVRYWLAHCEQQGIDPLAAVTDDVRGYIQSITHKSDTTIDSYYRSVQSFYTVIENDQMHDRLQLEHGHPCRDKNADYVTLHLPGELGEDDPACGTTLPSDAGWCHISAPDARDWQRDRETDRIGDIRLCAKCRNQLEERLLEQVQARRRRQARKEARRLEERVRKADLSCKPPGRR